MNTNMLLSLSLSPTHLRTALHWFLCWGANVFRSSNFSENRSLIYISWRDARVHMRQAFKSSWGPACLRTQMKLSPRDSRCEIWRSSEMSSKLACIEFPDVVLFSTFDEICLGHIWTVILSFLQAILHDKRGDFSNLDTCFWYKTAQNRKGVLPDMGKKAENHLIFFLIRCWSPLVLFVILIVILKTAQL